MNKFSFIPKNIIVAITLATLIVNVIKSCPVVCTCKWKGGKRKVECVDKNLTSLLTNIESETQVLDYSKNDLRNITERIFEKANLINLQKLYMSECGITGLHETAFHGLANLIELDLSANSLTTVPSSGFLHFPLLMRLILSSNPIRVLESGAFSALKYLTTLDLSDCRLQLVEKDAFEGPEKLEWLKLEGNELTTIAHADSLPPVAGGLSLHRNPWKCDCHLRNFRDWLSNSTSWGPKPIVAEPVCAEPSSYRGVAVSRLRIDDLACAPLVVPSSLFVEINEGRNISFVCQVNAVPEAQITWEFEGNPVAGNSSLVYPFYKYYAEEATTEQVSELFVFDAKKENNGTYSCTARNVAGKSTSNYTLSVITTQKEMRSQTATTLSYFHVLVSSVGTLFVVVLIALLVVSCLVCVNRRKTSTAKSRCSGAKSDVEYEIARRTTAKAVLSQSRPTTASKGDKNPDLIINAEGGSSSKEHEHCERLLLLPGDIKQTYLTLAGNTLLNTTIYESKALCAHQHRQPRSYDRGDQQLPLLLPATCQTVANGGPAGTIKLYLTPSSTPNMHNLYVNPFEGYVDTSDRRCWTLQVSENDRLEEKRRRVLIDCCNQTIYQTPPTPPTPPPNTVDEFVNLRHNLEGYPYPSKLKFASAAHRREEEMVTTPILSPPDPFKTGAQISPNTDNVEASS